MVDKVAREFYEEKALNYAELRTIITNMIIAINAKLDDCRGVAQRIEDAEHAAVDPSEDELDLMYDIKAELRDVQRASELLADLNVQVDSIFDATVAMIERK